MSIQAMSFVIEYSKHKSGALLTLMMIANAANSDGENAFPGIKRLARETRMTPRQVVRCIRVLEQSGELIRTTRGGKGTGDKTYYSIPMEKSDKLSYLSEAKSDIQDTSSVTSTTSIYNDLNRPLEPSINQEARAVFDCWAETVGSLKALFDDKRKARLASLLKKGFSVEQLCLVPKGALKSPHHCGQNSTGTKYLGIETLYRDVAQVEKFIELAGQQQQVVMANGNGAVPVGRVLFTGVGKTLEERQAELDADDDPDYDF